MHNSSSGTLFKRATLVVGVVMLLSACLTNKKSQAREPQGAGIGSGSQTGTGPVTSADTPKKVPTPAAAKKPSVAADDDTDADTTPGPAPAAAAPVTADADGEAAIAALNAKRAQQGVPPVRYDATLSKRCVAWAKVMEARGMIHDRSIYGTDERENIAGGRGVVIVPADVVNGWSGSPGHARAMYDQGGFPRATRAGYGQSGGFACLRLCPETSRGDVCPR